MALLLAGPFLAALAQAGPGPGRPGATTPGQAAPLQVAPLPAGPSQAAPVEVGLNSAAPAEAKRIFGIPPTQWDHALSRERPAQILGPSDLAALTGGLAFGLSPAEVNAMLPVPTPGVEWADLPFASEYPDEVRYFWVRLDATREPREGIKNCVGANSYIVFLFRNRALFRISWRLLPDAACASTHAAAGDIYARYLAIDGVAVLTTHYIAGKAEVVEITDPTVDYLMPYRWANRQRR